MDIPATFIALYVNVERLLNGKVAIVEGVMNINGFARVYKTIKNTDLYGFIDKYGNEVIPLKYEYALCYSEGLAVVRFNRKFGYVDNSNKIVIDIEFEDASSFENGKAKVRKNSKHYYINMKGETI